jgi:putative ABC transport system substrate-binding protein
VGRGSEGPQFELKRLYPEEVKESLPDPMRKLGGPKCCDAPHGFSMANSRVDSVVVTEDGEFAASFRAIATLALANKLPSIGAREYAEAGGLIGYGVNILRLYRRAAYFVDRILKGAKPADLPIEQPTKFELIVNLQTAKALGLAISETFLVRADAVIE